MKVRSLNRGFLRSGPLPYVIGVMVILVVLFYALRPTPEPDTLTVPAAPTAPEAPPPPPPETPAQHDTRAFDLVIERNRLIAPTGPIKVREGDEVVLNVIADSREQLHLHGYDLMLELSPGTPATLRFTADKAGRFEYELERAHIELGAIEVYPR